MRVHFAKQEGTAHGFSPTSFVSQGANRTPELIEAAVRRFTPVHYLGAGYENVVIPAIPAIDFRVEATNEAVEASTWPTQLQQPLVKVPLHHSHRDKTIYGVASGIRSAIVRIEGEWYRLKGCGNNDEGFVFATVSPHTPLVNIRGCAFVHTAQRELLMSHRINLLLNAQGLQGANDPLGWYKYTGNSPLPKVRRACVVLRTLGERRLQQHVLQGLERILPLVLEAVDVTHVIERFAEMRKPTGMAHATWLARLMRDEYPLPLVNGYDIPLPECAPSGMRLPEGADRRWSDLWRENCERLSLLLPQVKETGSVLAYVHWRFGWELGTTMRILQANDISWGTYTDSMGGHCNAHTNNLVLRKEDPGTPEAPFLAMLDLDMAFAKDDYVNKAGQHDTEEFQRLMTTEVNMMATAVSGDPSCSTGVREGEDLDEQHTAIKWLLRDTMLIAYEAALKGEKDEHPTNSRLTAACYCLLRLALITTADEIA